MTMDLFPLGHEGVALDRMETNRREEVFLGLKSGNQDADDGGHDCCSLLFRDHLDDKNDSWGNKTQSCCTSSFCGWSFV